MDKLRIGMTGFGQLGQQIYCLALQDARFQVVAVSEFGSPKILHRLLAKSMRRSFSVSLEGNYLVSHRLGTGGESIVKTRVLAAGQPNQIPWWDVFGTDVVIDTTGHSRSRDQMAPHLSNGAGRVILSALPSEDVDRVVLYGVNHDRISASDRIVSAGSASTTAMALALQVIGREFSIRQATATSVHAFTGDQILQDHAGPDYRRSRSGAKNIIPNETPALGWVQRVLPQLAGKLSGFALNVPVQNGSLLDLTVALEDPEVGVRQINDLFVAAASAQPDIFGTTSHPIVSSDVKGCSQSILVDLQGTLRAGARLIKVLAWHESLGHARRILDLAEAYVRLDASPVRKIA